jgi:SWI/SNF-related matrix-associated actin-dependent regulator 1 of chromatin subfamily A
MIRTTRLYEYQKEGVHKIQEFGGRALLADDMGLGKTLQALFWTWMHLDKGPYIVVCPAGLKWNWQQEARKHLGMRAEVLEKMRPPKGFKWSSNTIYILSYKTVGSVNGKSDSWAKVIRKMKPSLLILDEVHALKHRTSQRWKNCKAIAAKIKHVIGISGTPLTGKAVELWPILNIIKPKVFSSFWKVAVRYSRLKHTPWGTQYYGVVRGKELNKILKKEVMIRRRKKDVLTQLPSKTRAVVPISLSNYSEYKTAEKDFIRWLMKTHPKKANRARNAERLIRAGYLLRLVGELKLPSVRKWIDTFLEGSTGKLITFGVHKNVVRPLHKHYEDLSVRVDGSVEGKKRQEATDKFRKNHSCRILFGNIQAAGVGWNGQVAQDVMFCELDHLPANHTQAEDRAHRIGQTLPVTCWYLIGKGTIEEKMVKAIQEKQRVLDKVLDGKNVTKEGFDVLDLLEETLLKKNPKRKR